MSEEGCFLRLFIIREVNWDEILKKSRGISIRFPVVEPAEQKNKKKRLTEFENKVRQFTWSLKDKTGPQT